MNRYAAGYTFEREVMKYLSERGWECVRSAGSHGVTDIIASKPDDWTYSEYTATLLLIQCKRHGELRPGEWNALWRMASRWQASPILARRGENGRGLELWELRGPKVPHERNPPKVRFDAGELRSPEEV
jgi:Holliday junction resolvase